MAQEEVNLALRTLGVIDGVAFLGGLISFLAGRTLPTGGTSAFGGALLGLSGIITIVLLTFSAWQHERRTVPPAVHRRPSADELAAAIRRAMSDPDIDTSSPAGPRLNRVQREAIAARSLSGSAPATAQATPAPQMNRVQREAAEKAASALQQSIGVEDAGGSSATITPT